MANIYLVWRAGEREYDTFDSFVVCAETTEEARKSHPSGEGDVKEKRSIFEDWVVLSEIGDLKVMLLGEAKKGLSRGVICSSFNAS